MKESRFDTQSPESQDRHSYSQKKTKSFVSKGIAQFSGQAFGLILALFVSHLIARKMGIGVEADAFILGRRLITAVTETLNQVVGIVFIPFIAAQAAAGAGIWTIIKRSAGPAIVLGFFLALIFIVGAPYIVLIVAKDLAPETQLLASKVIAILSFALPATIATMALVAYCNVRDIFGIPAIIKQIPRAAVAIALLLAIPGNAALNAAWSFTTAHFAVVIIILALILWLSRKPLRMISNSPIQTTPATIRRSWAAVILASSALAFLWFETYVAASLGSGNVAALDFGQRLGALLGNTFATAFGLVVFADLSRKAAQGDKQQLTVAFKRALVIGMALAIPISIAVIVNARSLVDLILGYGAFAQAEQRDEVIYLVQLMAVAPIGALALRILLVRIIADSELPMVRLLAIAMLVDFMSRIILFSILVPKIGLAGIPMTLIICPIFTAVILSYTLHSSKTRAQS